MHRAIAILTLGFTIGCGSDSDTSTKGAEENPLTDGKNDSFFRPTEHGTVQFGLSNAAELTDDAQFHAWNFDLTADAEVTLQTEVSSNLDTVMYVYKRENEDESWGRYIKKNDDYSGEIYSRIDLQGTVGHYRVIVKGFKKALRGSFSLSATCSGDGCQTASPNACVEGEYELKGTTTDWTEQCNASVFGVLGSDIVASSSGAVPVTEHCSATGVIQQGVSSYLSYWDDLIGLDELFYDGLDEAEVDYEYEQRSNGHVITLGAGGDEDGLTLILDSELNTLVAYQHNQSPTVDFYCGGDQPAETTGPDENCFSDILFNYPTDNADTSSTESGTGSLSDVEALGVARMELVTADFKAHFEVSDIEVDYTVDRFTDSFRVALTSTEDDQVSATYVLIPQFGDQILIRRSEDSAVFCN